MLKDAGLDFEVIPPNVDESGIRATLSSSSHEDLVAVAQNLASVKSKAISELHPDAMVIGADQVLIFDGEILTKPEDLNVARNQLVRLRTNDHMLVSAVACACSREVQWQTIRTARLLMRNFSADFLDTYLDAMGKRVTTTVGGYEIEGRGIQLFSEIEGDLFTIQGLPLMELLAFLRSRDLIVK